MAKEYFPMYHSYRDKFKNLSDQELGRLVRAALDYSVTGTYSELKGREALVFDFVVYDIDRAAKNSAKASETNRENAYKRWDKQKSNDAKACESMRNDATACDGMRNDATACLTNTSTKTITKTNIPPKSPKGDSDISFGDDLTAAVNDWLSYKRERRESYKPTGHKLLLSQIANKAKEYGEAAVAEVIRTSISSGYKGIVFDRLRNMPIKAADDFDPDDPYAAWGDST